MNYKKLRRSGRISKSVPILLIDSDTDGRTFSEETRTVVLSLHGAGVISFHKLLAEQELILRSPETSREAEIRVVGEIGMQGDKHTYGVAFVDDYLDFWQMDFPPPPSQEERPPQRRETGQSHRSTRLTELEIPAQHGQSLISPLDEERVSAQEELIPVAEMPSAAAAQQNLHARKASVAVEERRLRVRAKVNYFACVRSEAFGDDIVNCIDMSRGNLGFWTENPYVVSAEVRIAVPFAPESPNTPAIFVAARVVNIAESPERKMFRCGVMFTPASGAQAHT